MTTLELSIDDILRICKDYSRHIKELEESIDGVGQVAAIAALNPALLAICIEMHDQKFKAQLQQRADNQPSPLTIALREALTLEGETFPKEEIQ